MIIEHSITIKFEKSLKWHCCVIYILKKVILCSGIVEEHGIK